MTIEGRVTADIEARLRKQSAFWRTRHMVSAADSANWLNMAADYIRDLEAAVRSHPTAMIERRSIDGHGNTERIAVFRASEWEAWRDNLDRAPSKLERQKEGPR